MAVFPPSLVAELAKRAAARNKGRVSDASGSIPPAVMRKAVEDIKRHFS